MDLPAIPQVMTTTGLGSSSLGSKIWGGGNWLEMSMVSSPASFFSSVASVGLLMYAWDRLLMFAILGRTLEN